MNKPAITHEMQQYTKEQIQEHLATCPISADLRVLTNQVSANNAAMAELLELAKGIKFSIKLIGYIERISVFIVKIAAAVGILWATWRFVIIETLEHIGKNGK